MRLRMMPARMRSATSRAPCLVGVDEDGGELLAAVARREVDVAHGLLDDARHGAQRAVAGAVAVPVVEGAEVVEVAEEQRDGSSPCSWQRSISSLRRSWR